MHVLFISACEKRAIKRTRAVLDSYALRTGEKTWASPMTSEGLHEIRSALKSAATRQTAVACYRNEGRQRMKLLWVVGSRRAFGPDGHFPAGTMLAKTKPVLPGWAKTAALLAQAAGWCHDLGKASLLFQDKLSKAGPVKDCVRHEWVSMRLVQAMRAGKSWDEAWAQINGNETWLRDDPFQQGIHSAWDALDYLVVSHHRLLGPADEKRKSGLPDSSKHFSGESLDKNRLKPKAELPGEAFETAKRLLARVEKLTEGKDHRYWRAVAGIARAGLILADHEVSAEDQVPATPPYPAHALYANTNKVGMLNQELCGHLKNVAGAAADKVYRLATLRLPGLSEQTLESVCRPAGAHPDFAWQDLSAAALESFRARCASPMLLFNMACTGSGKTRMNARAACLLANGPARFAVALNLRSLTLQTGAALRGQLGIGEDELACVIGDKTAQILHEKSQPVEDEDGNPPEQEFESFGEEFALPAWLEPLAKAKPVLRNVIAAPLLVSTVDYLIAAGSPQTQGHHACALLRMAGSDLVLDEVDGYDPKPLVAVLRLVQVAALFGRNVICSTATLAAPVADAIHRAYRSGAELRAAMEGQAPRFALGFIDNYVQARLLEDAAGGDFQGLYQSHINEAKPKFSAAWRVPCLQTLATKDLAGWQQAALAGVLRLHQAHGFLHEPSGKRISFGLVRVANVAPAIETASFLAKALPQARVACYHSRDFAIRRYLKERTLDRLLTRKPTRGDPSGNSAIMADPALDALLRQARTDEVIFIVVATPVEEVGRDHDFDWAVIDPSSTRSIVQTAGRVNRHRKIPVGEPNIALLQFNYKAATTADPSEPVFTRPGFETLDSPFPHDLNLLLNHPLSAIDAGLMFDGHPFAGLDNKSIAHAMEKPLKWLFDAGQAEAWWANHGIYESFPLRDKEKRCDWKMDKDGEFWLWRKETGKPAGWVKQTGSVTLVDATENAWLDWTTQDLLDACDEHGLGIEQGIRFSTRDDTVSLDWSFGAR